MEELQQKAMTKSQTASETPLKEHRDTVGKFWECKEFNFLFICEFYQ